MAELWGDKSSLLEDKAMKRQLMWQLHLGKKAIELPATKQYKARMHGSEASCVGWDMCGQADWPGVSRAHP